MSKPQSKKDDKPKDKKDDSSAKKKDDKPKDKKDDSSAKKETSDLALSIGKWMIIIILAAVALKAVGCSESGNANSGQPSIEELRRMIEESNRKPLPTDYGLYKKGVTHTGPGVTMKAEYLPGGDILLNCWTEEDGIPVYHTLRWNPKSKAALNGQWTRTEHHKSGGFIRPTKTTLSEYSGGLMVSNIPGTDRLAIALFTPDKNDPSKDRLLGEDWGGGEGVLHPVW